MVVVDERLEICEQENWLPLRRLFVRTYLKFAWGGDASLGFAERHHRRRGHRPVRSVAVD
jgi:hypothetical protein